MSQKFKATISGAEYEALPDAVKGFYQQNGDKYIASLEGAETEEAIKALRSAKQHEATEKNNLQTQLDALKGILGDTKPEDLQKLLTDTKKAQEEALKTAGKWDEMKAQMRKEFEEKELNPTKEAANKYKTATEKYLIDSKFRKAIESLKPFEGAADALLPHIKPKVRLVEVNGELEPQIFDGDTLQVNSKGEPMTFEEYSDKTFRQSPVFGRFFQADDTAGSGSPAFSAGAGAGGAKTVSRTDQAAMSNNLEAIAAGEVTVR